MVKAKKVCINKIYDLNEPLAHYILAIEMNKCELKDIELDKSIILKDVLRGLQFMHDCGYIYRDLHPEHIMQSFEGNVVFVGLKRMKKYMDIKGRVL
jgi:serine/threonine protein kinase